MMGAATGAKWPRGRNAEDGRPPPGQGRQGSRWTTSSGLQSLKTINVCWFKLCSSWHLGTTALEY